MIYVALWVTMMAVTYVTVRWVQLRIDSSHIWTQTDRLMAIFISVPWPFTFPGFLIMGLLEIWKDKPASW